MSIPIYAPLLLVVAWLYKVSTTDLNIESVLTTKAATIAFGPLRAIPGPFLNRWTNLPLKIHTLRGRKVYYVDDLHAQYGPAVRIAPTEIAYADLSSTREIHKIGSGYLKSQFYADFTGESAEAVVSPGLFAVIDPVAHATRRRLFARAFAYSSLVEWEPLLQEKTKLAINGIQADIAQKGGVADILKWWSSLATDLIAELSFGEGFHALENGEKSDYSRDLEKVFLFSGLQYELSPLTTPLRYVPVPAVQFWLDAPKRLVAHGTAAIAKHKALQRRGETKATLFDRAMAEDKSGVRLSDPDVEREASNLIVAGSDTTAITLTYLVWTLLQPCHKDVKERLQQEVRTLPKDFSSMQAKELPYLSAVIQEALRLYGAAPGSLPRTVPKGGRTLGGYTLPEDTIVSTAAFTLHRNATIFPRPLEFKPERWLDQTQEMKDAFMPFGGGSRVCIGMHLAYMELSLATAMFFRELPGTKTLTSESDMEFENYFVIAPKGHTCEITLASTSDGL
ncbi:hypothetical protein BP5796_06314 [Coleophoma crateriformis]|uniref:Uncharacterized protein n=1 Tax=Coleophoma crateriformis TaxID=565419 RepID=A0A3D8RWK4_9HELO|nr:hypothetical protein BP5796_06314 [Coleophoma crateriformis]